MDDQLREKLGRIIQLLEQLLEKSTEIGGHAYEIADEVGRREGGDGE